MVEGDDSIFPLVNRQTPIADRVRNRVAQRGLGEAMGRRLAEFIKEDDPTATAEAADKMVKDLRHGLADELQMNTEEISRDVDDVFIEAFTDMEVEDVLTDDALEAMGVGVSTEEEETSEDEDSNAFSS